MALILLKISSAYRQAILLGSGPIVLIKLRLYFTINDTSTMRQKYIHESSVSRSLDLLCKQAQDVFRNEQSIFRVPALAELSLLQ